MASPLHPSLLSPPPTPLRRKLGQRPRNVFPSSIRIIIISFLGLTTSLPRRSWATTAAKRGRIRTSSTSRPCSSTATFAFSSGPKRDFGRNRLLAAAASSSAAMHDPPPPSLTSFLRECSTKLASSPSEQAPSASSRRYRMTIGNEAGDADSIVSALVHGHVLKLEDEGSSTNDHDGGADVNELKKDTIYVPLVGVPRADLPLRRETTLLLNMAGIGLDSLLCIDDPPFVATLLSPDAGGDVDEVEIVLLDHNRIRSSLSHFSANVVEILDHHEDEGHHESVTGERRNVAFDGRDALVGSACTLVAERLLRVTERAGDASDMRGTKRLDPSAALVLLGVILLDTMNMSVEAGKGTGRDGAAIQSLLEQTDWTELDKSTLDDADESVFKQDSTERPEREALYDLLRNSKFDRTFWSELSPWDCLRIDYKRFDPPRASNLAPPLVSFGMSSVLLPLTDLVSKADFTKSVERFLSKEEEGGADVPLLAVLTMTLVGGSPHREMLLVGRADLVDATADYVLREKDAAFLQVTEAEDDALAPGECDPQKAGDLKMRRFHQGNTKGSRKQVAPVLLKVASTLQL